MARLTALPSIDIIRGFKGVLDFYLWKGLPCVRAWPRWRPARQSDPSKAAALLFGAIIKGYSLLGDGALQAFQEDAADQPRTARDIYMTATLGHLHERTLPPPPPPPEEEMYDAYICLRDLKSVGTHAGTFTSGAWQTRTLNNEQADTLDICSLLANQITLPAGTYRALIACPACRVNRHQARLYDITNALTLLLGTSSFSTITHTVSDRSFVHGRFTLAAETVLEVQHRCEQTQATYGFGVSCTFTNEIYTIAELWRELETE